MLIEIKVIFSSKEQVLKKESVATVIVEGIVLKLVLTGEYTG